jgi:hypothetical protein
LISHHRSQKGIESDINRNCQQNAQEKFPSDGPAEENCYRIEEKEHKRKRSLIKADNLRSGIGEQLKSKQTNQGTVCQEAAGMIYFAGDGVTFHVSIRTFQVSPSRL